MSNTNDTPLPSEHSTSKRASQEDTPNIVGNPQPTDGIDTILEQFKEHVYDTATGRGGSGQLTQEQAKQALQDHVTREVIKELRAVAIMYPLIEKDLVGSLKNRISLLEEKLHEHI